MSRTSTRAVSPALTAALAVALALAGCGGDAESGEPAADATTTSLTPTSLTDEQQRQAETMACLGELSPDPDATIDPEGCLGEG